MSRLNTIPMSNSTSSDDRWLERLIDCSEMNYTSDEECFQMFSNLSRLFRVQTCETKCERTDSYRFWMGTMFFTMLVICLCANTLNIAVYQFTVLKSSLAVKLLASKALANMCFMLTLIPVAVRARLSSDEFKYYEDYWMRAYPYVLWLSNIFGTLAIWLIVLMTLERFLYVKYPIESRKYCTTQNFGFAVGCVILPISVLVHSAHPINREMRKKTCQLTLTETEETVEMGLRKGRIHSLFDAAYHWFNLVFIIMVPLLLLVYFSGVIAWRLLYATRNMRRHIAEKRCVTAITLLTTVVYILLELPAVGLFLAAAIKGPSIVQKHRFMCRWQVLVHFLAICEASVLFFIYFIFSARFRQLFISRLTCNEHINNLLAADESSCDKQANGIAKTTEKKMHMVQKGRMILVRSESSMELEEQAKMLNEVFPKPGENTRQKRGTDSSNIRDTDFEDIRRESVL